MTPRTRAFALAALILSAGPGAAASAATTADTLREAARVYLQGDFATVSTPE